MKRIVLAFLAALALLPTGAHARGHTWSQRYTLGLGDLMVQCGVNRGGACFAPSIGDTYISAKAIDDLLNPVGTALEFQDTNGTTIGNLVTGCGQVPVTRIPLNAVKIVVSIDGPLFGPQDCLLQGLGIGTQGLIVATFS